MLRLQGNPAKRNLHRRNIWHCRRYAASGSTPSHEHHHPSEADVQFAPEGFTSKSWLWGLGGALALYAGYELTKPPPGEKHFITKFLEREIGTGELWKARNDQHLRLSEEKAAEELLFRTAKRPCIRRLRYPEAMERASPFLEPVGSRVDISNVKIRYEDR